MHTLIREHIKKELFIGYLRLTIFIKTQCIVSSGNLSESPVAWCHSNQRGIIKNHKNNQIFLRIPTNPSEQYVGLRYVIARQI